MVFENFLRPPSWSDIEIKESLLDYNFGNTLGVDLEIKESLLDYNFGNTLVVQTRDHRGISNDTISSRSEMSSVRVPGLEPGTTEV